MDYRLYGLHLRANRRLAGLEPVPSRPKPDVTVRLGGLPPVPIEEIDWRPLGPPMQAWRAETPDGGWVRLRYSGGGMATEILMDSPGDRLWAGWTPGVRLQDVSTVLLGPVMGCLLRLRGCTVLHAGVVAVGEGAILLCGPRGAGKSTLALALSQRGANVISDDMAVLSAAGGGVHVQRGPAQLRLRPKTADALCGSFESLQPLWSVDVPRPQKRYLDLPAAGGEDAVPLAAVYVLSARADAAVLERFDPGAAVLHLMAHRHVPFLTDSTSQARDFRLVASVAQRVPVWRLVSRDGLEHLGALADAIVGDARKPTAELP